MDLCEIKKNKNRHPWELARYKALKRIIRRIIAHPEKALKVLDIGCGDGYFARRLINTVFVKTIDAVDINLSFKQINKIKLSNPEINFYNDFSLLKRKPYNLVLLLDVIEHVGDDKEFLSDIIDTYLASGGVILITAPAFNILFSSHDKFLGHFRRYNLKKMLQLISCQPLKEMGSGYLFFSLLPLRIIKSLLDKFIIGHSHQNNGIGHWKYGPIITKFIELLLVFDSRTLMFFGNIGIKLPGLTVWTICIKQQS